MTLHDLDRENKISGFVAMAPRHKVVVVCGIRAVDGLPSLDVGRSLASFIRDNELSDLKLQALECLERLFAANTVSEAGYGKFICLVNTGILFEPELGFDVTDIIARLSKNTLVVLPTEGIVEGDCLGMFPNSTRQKINLGRLNYIIL